MKIVGIECNISGNNCCVIDSYKVTNKKTMLKFIHSLCIVYPQFKARSEKSYLRE